MIKVNNEIQIYKSIVDPKDKDNFDFNKRRDIVLKNKLLNVTKEKCCLKRILDVQDNFSKLLESYSYDFTGYMKDIRKS